MTDGEFYGIAQKLIGRSYKGDSYNCRHLACDFMLEMGIDAYQVFGVGGGENKKQWRDSYRALVKSFERVDNAESCLLLAYGDGNHVAIKHKNKVLHNYGAGKNGQVLLTDWLSFKDSFHRIDFYLFPVK